jgi:putative tryptophan/tyrosine transport system substrate-binding protein
MALADDLVRRNVNVIVAQTVPAVLAAHAATGSIPIVFQMAADPVEAGLVVDLNRPEVAVTPNVPFSARLSTRFARRSRRDL